MTLTSLPSVLRTGLLVALSLVVLVQLPVAAAEKKDSLTLSPATKRLQLEAGTTINDEFTVINDGDVDYDFSVYTGPYSVKDDTYTPDFTSQTDNGDAYKWISFAKSTYHIGAGQSVQVPFTVRVGSTVPAGGHYGVIFVETVVTSGDSTGVARKKRLGIILYATVKGETEMAGSVKRTQIDGYQPAAPLTAGVWVENTGKTDFDAKSTMTVSTLFGNAMYTNKSESIVLPNTTRHIEHTWADSPWVGVYKTKLSVEILGKTHTTESLVVIIPRWMFVILGIVVLVGSAYALRGRASGSHRSHRR